VFNLSLAYSKSNNKLTVDVLANEGTPWWVWLLVGLGVVLIGMGGWFFVNESSKKSKKTKSKYARRRSGVGRQAHTGKKPAKFCHQCGSAALEGDKFCRQCGQKLRV
jgi:hypothetical protein